MRNRALKAFRNPRLASLVMAAALFGGAVAAHAYTGEKFARDAKLVRSFFRAPHVAYIADV